jgi:hypothetical protein
MPQIKSSAVETQKSPFWGAVRMLFFLRGFSGSDLAEKAEKLKFFAFFAGISRAYHS